MSALIIEGGQRLAGRVEVEGNKNAVLPLLAACLLTDKECVLSNAPRIRDVAVMAELLQSVGAKVLGVGPTRCGFTAPKSRATSRIQSWSVGCAGRCFCSGRFWRGSAGRGCPSPAGTFRAAAASPLTCRR